jgi:acyl dehydratase
MSDALDLETLTIGATLRPVVRMPTREQCVRYAGAANDFSPIHYDDDNARQRGFPAVIVHGLLKAAFLGELLDSWAAPHGGWVRRLATQYRGIDFPGRPLICQARVTDKSISADRWLVDLDVWIDNADGKTTTSGSATVDFGNQAGTS